MVLLLFIFRMPGISHYKGGQEHLYQYDNVASLFNAVKMYLAKAKPDENYLTTYHVND